MTGIYTTPPYFTNRVSELTTLALVADDLLVDRTAPIPVPGFTRIEPYRSPDGQTEIDALAENGERWAVEVKWRQKRVGRSELEQLLIAAAELRARPWCVSQAGFTPDALTFAAENAVLISNAEDLAALTKLAR